MKNIEIYAEMKGILKEMKQIAKKYGFEENDSDDFPEIMYFVLQDTVADEPLYWKHDYSIKDVRSDYARMNFLYDCLLLGEKLLPSYDC